jgi:hypothetical protein
MNSQNPPPPSTHMLQISTLMRPPKNPCVGSLSSKPHASLGHSDQTLLRLITVTYVPTTLIYTYVLEKSKIRLSFLNYTTTSEKQYIHFF